MPSMRSARRRSAEALAVRQTASGPQVGEFALPRRLRVEFGVPDARQFVRTVGIVKHHQLLRGYTRIVVLGG